MSPISDGINCCTMLVVVQLPRVVTVEPPLFPALYPAQFCCLRFLLHFWTTTSLLLTLPSHTLPSLSYFLLTLNSRFSASDFSVYFPPTLPFPLANNISHTVLYFFRIYTSINIYSFFVLFSFLTMKS